MIEPLPFHGDGESGNELWAPFPSDILGHIASKLTGADYASACAACKSWRAVFSPHRPGLLPFLLLPPHYTLPDPLRLLSPTPPLPDYHLGPIVPFPRVGHGHYDSPFFPLDSLRNPTFRPLPSLSDTARHVCVGSSHGWLILLGPTSHISLLNPLTADTIPLPAPLPSGPLSFPLYDESTVDRYLLFRGDPPRRLLHLAALVRLAALSADPSADPSSFILVVVLGNDVSSRFFTCGPSDGYAAWKPHSPSSFPEAYGLTDLIFHRGRCFAAITWSYSGGSLHGPADAIAVFDFHAYPAFQGLLHVRIRENYVVKNYANFLIESAGELLLVTRHGEIDAGRILVHRLPPLEGGGPFVPTPEASLGNQALFLGTGNSVLVQARDFRQFIRRNCIYFTDVHRKVVNGRAVSVGCVYVFNMEKGITRKAFEVAQEHEMNLWSNLRPWWVMPNLRKRDPRAPRDTETDSQGGAGSQ